MSSNPCEVSAAASEAAGRELSKRETPSGSSEPDVGEFTMEGSLGRGGGLGAHSTTHDRARRHHHVGSPKGLEGGRGARVNGHACQFVPALRRMSTATECVVTVLNERRAALERSHQAVEAVAGVTEARHDVAELVELLVEGADDDRHLAALGRLAHGLEAF